MDWLSPRDGAAAEFGGCWGQHWEVSILLTKMSVSRDSQTGSPTHQEDFLQVLLISSEQETGGPISVRAP